MIKVEEITSKNNHHYDISTTGLKASQTGVAEEIEFKIDDHIKLELRKKSS